MTDWIKHNGGPQPVADDVWVEVLYTGAPEGKSRRIEQAIALVWAARKSQWRILNQHRIDAARLEGIRLGLEAAATEVWNGALGGLSLEEGTNVIRALNPETIAREAVLDQLTREAQAENMGYDND